jgi:adenine-specific DNA methylase
MVRIKSELSATSTKAPLITANEQIAVVKSGVRSREEKTLESVSEAAIYATERLGMTFEEYDIAAMIRFGLLANLGEDEFCEVRLQVSEVETYGVLLDWISETQVSDDLLAGTVGRQRLPLSINDAKNGRVMLTVESDLSLLVPTTEFRPYECQLFLREFRRQKRSTEIRSREPRAILSRVENIAFRSTSPELADFAASLWRVVSARADRADEAERRTTLSIYGVKTRLLPFVTSVIRSVAADGTLICDLMSGSGIVARKLSKTHKVFANDANAYGSIAALALTTPLALNQLSELTERLKLRAAENVRALEKVFGKYLALELELLHTARTSDSMEMYRIFCLDVPAFFGKLDKDTSQLSDEELALRQMIALRRSDKFSFPYVLATASWANVHFGLRQTILLDSLRYAVEAETGPVREILLAALMQAALLCASGPHFAQPFKPKALPQFKALIDKRSKRVDAEFFSILSRYPALKVTANALVAATKGNWRDALKEFSQLAHGRSGLVYVDPPYTQVQYSRYYHVLNVLAEYDYPECSGPGRCPERSYRFSSRFEYKRAPAMRELKALVAECAAAGLGLAISYSRSGALTIGEIVGIVRDCFGTIELFQANIRHHMQGRATSRSSSETLEFIIVAYDPRAVG